MREEYGFEPTSLDQLRKGCYDVDARVDDMDVNGIAASLNFASFAGIDGGLFIKAPDKKQALTHLRAYNDWHVDEWCGAHPGRFIPLRPFADVGHGRDRRRSQAPRRQRLPRGDDEREPDHAWPAQRA